MDRDARCAQRREWYYKNKERCKAYTKQYRIDKPEKTKQHNIQRKQKRLENKFKVMNYYSKGTMECICCGVKGIEFLTLDHINGGGEKHRRKAKTGAGCDFYAWLLKTNYEDEDIQVMCYNCNCAKKDTGTCPHSDLTQ